MANFPTQRSPTPVTLLHRARNDREALDLICRLYEPYVRSVALRYRPGLQQHDLDDVTQAVLLVASVKLPKFEHNGQLGAWRRWLHRTTHNRLQLILKKKGRLSESLPIDVPDSYETGDWRDEDMKLLEYALEELKKRYRANTIKCFTLYAIEGRSAQETARELGIEVDTVYKTKQRVMAALREFLHGPL